MMKLKIGDMVEVSPFYRKYHAYYTSSQYYIILDIFPGDIYNIKCFGVVEQNVKHYSEDHLELVQ